MSTPLTPSTLCTPSERPLNRGRDDLDHAMAIAATLEVERSKRFWFPGGTVIIQAENTQFKIHWDILAARSSVFKDLFDLPQADGEPQVDGCPLVVVQDAVEDWAIILEVLYYSRPIDSVDRDLAFYVSIVRLGRKYEFTDFPGPALKHIQFAFDKLILHRSAKTVAGLTLASLFKLATLVEELGIRVLLPDLYFCVLTSLTLLEISDGLAFEGAMLTLPPHFRQMALQHRDRFVRELRIAYRWITDPFTPEPVPTALCKTPFECRFAFEQKRYSIIRDDILINLPTLHAFPGMCLKCHEKMRGLITSKFANFYYGNLPSIFDLHCPPPTISC